MAIDRTISWKLYGFPFESVYNEEPIPILIDRYYNFRDLDSIEIQMRDNDRRGIQI